MESDTLFPVFRIVKFSLQLLYIPSMHEWRDIHLPNKYRPRWLTFARVFALQSLKVIYTGGVEKMLKVHTLRARVAEKERPGAFRRDLQSDQASLSLLADLSTRNGVPFSGKRLLEKAKVEVLNSGEEGVVHGQAVAAIRRKFIQAMTRRTLRDETLTRSFSR